MQQLNSLPIAAGRKAGVFHWTGAAFAGPQRRTVGLWNRRRWRLFEGIAAFFGQAALGSKALPLGKYEPFLTFYCAAIVVLGVLATAGSVHAGDKGHQLGAPADIGGWVDKLANRNGANCCSDADGVRPQEVVWEIGKSQYRVRVRDQWIDVPHEAVVQGPNYLGHAVVWIYEDPLLDDAYENFPYIRCFLPGPAG